MLLTLLHPFRFPMQCWRTTSEIKKKPHNIPTYIQRFCIHACSLYWKEATRWTNPIHPYRQCFYPGESKCVCVGVVGFKKPFVILKLRWDLYVTLYFMKKKSAERENDFLGLCFLQNFSNMKRGTFEVVWITLKVNEIYLRINTSIRRR